MTAPAAIFALLAACLGPAKVSPAPAPVLAAAAPALPDGAEAAAVAVRLSLAQGLAAPPPAVAAAVARPLLTARELTLCWLLAHDPVPEVALAAAQAAVQRCTEESEDICVVLLGFFLRRSEPPASALARQALAARRPLAALVRAPVAWRRAAVLAAAGRARLHWAAEASLLRRLAEDPDPEVQQAAAAALMVADR